MLLLFLSFCKCKPGRRPRCAVLRFFHCSGLPLGYRPQDGKMWRDVCNPHETDITDHIRASDIKDRLLEEDVITDLEMRSLMRRQGREDDDVTMRWLLVDVLYRRSEEELDIFIAVLEKHRIYEVNRIGKTLRDEYNKHNPKAKDEKKKKPTEEGVKLMTEETLDAEATPEADCAGSRAGTAETCDPGEPLLPQVRSSERILLERSSSAHGTSVDLPFPEAESKMAEDKIDTKGNVSKLVLGDSEYAK